MKPSFKKKNNNSKNKTIPSKLFFPLPAILKGKKNLAWWCMPLISALRRERQADLSDLGQPGMQYEFQDSHSYTRKSYLEKEKINKQTIKVKVENRFEGGSWEELTNISEEINRLFFS